MASILVTGGAGFIGSFLVDELIEKGHSVRILDNLVYNVHRNKVPHYLNKNAQFIKGDVRSKEDVRKALEGIDVVFHEAALVGIEPSMKNPREFTDANTLGTANIMTEIISGDFSVKKVIVPSSVAIYGEPAYQCKKCKAVSREFRKKEQLDLQQWEHKCANCGSAMESISIEENAPKVLDNVYSITKYDQETISLAVGKEYGIPVVALRYFNVYGPRQSAVNPYSGAITKFSNLFLSNLPISLFEDGNQSRDFINVKDIVQANMLAMLKSSADYKSYNVATGKGTSIMEIGSIIKSAIGSKQEIIVTNKHREGDVRHCTADISKIRKELGFAPKISIQEGIMETVQWYKESHANK